MTGFIRQAGIGHSRKQRYRALFLSDLHLGTRGSRTKAFLDFLRSHEADTIYLVGDIIDFWRLQRGIIWPACHDEVVQMLLERVQNGCRIVFIPGNHDEALRGYCGTRFGGIEIERDSVHITAGGRRVLIVHGDEFDVADSYSRWLRYVGDRMYEFVLWCDRPLNWTRRQLGLCFWSLSGHVKTRVRAAASYIEQFEIALAEEAKRRDLHGVICGHVHKAADRQIGSVRYMNCGDWVESLTAIAEDENGRLRLLRWRDAAPEPKPVPVRVALPKPAYAWNQLLTSRQNIDAA
jgi:UDP-2,3-diacylglucosamine pyrophosphatase LpxH